MFYIVSQALFEKAALEMALFVIVIKQLISADYTLVMSNASKHMYG